ncbi:chromate transporter-domain-containing protein [Gorgonomyces haynaldii]|nr:chromate transporter-domain-containing protein [Gorgonomyces haynaldii]
MTGFAYGVAQLANGLPGWALHLQNGLTSSAVGLVALAAYKLSTKILVDPLLVLIASVCACLAILITNFPYLYPIMMIGGGAIEYVRQYIVSKRQEAQQTRVEANDLEKEQDDEISHYGFNYSVKAGLSMFGIWVILLVVSIVFRQTYVDRSASVFGTLYFVGSIIFGGGPVVVPLLQSYVVEAGWMTNPEFLIGLAIINVMPGPNFNIGAFCGALALRATSPVGGAVLGYLGIFLPGILLMSALLPLWKRFRQLKTVQAIFKGVNAAAVGLTFSAIYILAKKSIVATDGTFGLVFPITDSPLYTSVAAMTYASVGFANLPAPASIFIGGIVGVIEWALVK